MSDLKFGKSIGQNCPRCEHRKITEESARKSEDIKAEIAFCDRCLDELLRIRLAQFHNQPKTKPERSTSRIHHDEQPASDEIRINDLTTLLEVPKNTVEVLIKVKLLHSRKLNDQWGSRVIPKADVRALIEAISENSPVLDALKDRQTILFGLTRKAPEIMKRITDGALD